MYQTQRMGDNVPLLKSLLVKLIALKIIYTFIKTLYSPFSLNTSCSHSADKITGKSYNPNES